MLWCYISRIIFLVPARDTLACWHVASSGWAAFSVFFSRFGYSAWTVVHFPFPFGWISASRSRPPVLLPRESTNKKRRELENLGGSCRIRFLCLFSYPPLECRMHYRTGGIVKRKKQHETDMLRVGREKCGEAWISSYLISS
jgi:hypothetical protein